MSCFVVDPGLDGMPRIDRYPSAPRSLVFLVAREAYLLATLWTTMVTEQLTEDMIDVECYTGGSWKYSSELLRYGMVCLRRASKVEVM